MGVGRRIYQLGAARLDRLADSGQLVRREVVQDHEVFPLEPMVGASAAAAPPRPGTLLGRSRGFLDADPVPVKELPSRPG